MHSWVSQEAPLPNRQLSLEELEKLFAPLIAEVRKRVRDLSGGDEDLLWALRRKLFKELAYDERGKPMQRRKLKDLKRAEQDNKCAVCHASLPARYVVLDRIEAMKGYTAENTRLICQTCDTKVQIERGYK
jgi:ribosomal protein L44E